VPREPGRVKIAGYHNSDHSGLNCWMRVHSTF
jgi:hypothetical protein